jgi:hypothetical protein
LNSSLIDLFVNVAETQDSGMVGLGTNSYKIDNQRIDFIDDWCLLITKDCFENCGPFEESLKVTGSSFLFTLSCQYGGYKPQLLNNNVVHHYQKSSFSSNDFEKYASEAQANLPKLLKNIQMKFQGNNKV